MIELRPNVWINTDSITSITFNTQGGPVEHRITYGENTDFDIIIARVNKFLEPFGVKMKDMP